MSTFEAAPVSARREPTPDHPPYAQMIGEAIEALRGSASEEVISAFILGRHPGVPQAAHDRLLRHYLAKHKAEGLFVCTAQGRYSRAASNAAHVTVAKHSQSHDRQPTELALVVVAKDDPTTATDHDQTCTTAPTAAHGTKHSSRPRPPCNEAPVQSPSTWQKKKPRDRGRQRKVQDLYNRNVVLPPVPPPKPRVLPASNQMWCVLALPAPEKKL